MICLLCKVSHCRCKLRCITITMMLQWCYLRLAASFSNPLQAGCVEVRNDGMFASFDVLGQIGFRFNPQMPTSTEVDTVKSESRRVVTGERNACGILWLGLFGKNIRCQSVAWLWLVVQRHLYFRDAAFVNVYDFKRVYSERQLLVQFGEVALYL